MGFSHHGDIVSTRVVDVSGDMTSHDERLYQLISNHAYTGSTRNRDPRQLGSETSGRNSGKVMPVEYRLAAGNGAMPAYRRGGE